LTPESAPRRELRVHLRELIVCPHCDGLFRLAKLAPNETARCPDCLQPLQGHRTPSRELVLASALAGVICIALATASPVLTASFGGLKTEVNVLSAPSAFDADGFAMAAWALALVSFTVPLVQVLALSWTLAFALAQRRAPGFTWLLPLLQTLRPWAMVEVFFLGTLVVMVKVGGWVSIVLGPGFWSLAGFSALLATAHRFDSATLWEQLDTS
jgi:paraquat-inducible protein A